MDQRESSNVGTVLNRIVRTPETCGGKPRIAGTRIKVQHIAVWYERQALSPDEIVSAYPHLTLSDVHAALAYYYDHRDEIDEDIREGRRLADELRGSASSIFDKVARGHAGDDSLPPG